MTKSLRTAALIMLALVATMTLESCGRKEKLTPPHGADFPRQYPRE